MTLWYLWSVQVRESANYNLRDLLNVYKDVALSEAWVRGVFTWISFLIQEVMIRLTFPSHLIRFVNNGLKIRFIRFWLIDSILTNPAQDPDHRLSERKQEEVTGVNMAQMQEADVDELVGDARLLQIRSSAKKNRFGTRRRGMDAEALTKGILQLST